MLIDLNLYSIPPLISALVFLLVGVFIFLRNRRRLSNTLFFLICFFTAWWQGSWFFLFNLKSEVAAELLARFGYIGIILIPSLFFHFIISFLKQNKKLDRIFLFSSYSFSFLFILSLFFTDHFVCGVYDHFWGFYPNAGPLHLLYLVLLTVLFVRILYILLNALFRKKHKYSDYKYKQMQYFLLGLIFYTLASWDFLMNYGADIYPFGFIFILIFISLIAHSIARYKLFNVKVLTSELLVTSFSLVLFFNIFLSASTVEYIWKTVIFFIFVGLSRSIIKNIIKETEAEEKIKKYSHRLQKANARLKQLNEHKTEFMSFAAHQLRSPLTSVKAFSSLVAEDSFGNTPTKVQGVAQKIHDASDAMAESVEDYLNITRIEQGRMEYNMEELDAYDLARGVVEELRANAYEKDLKLKISSDKYKKYPVQADHSKLRQIIGNFVDNAIKYTQEGEVKVRVERKDGKVQVSVRDTGMGMSRETIKKLFQRYSRADDTQGISGTGLGLYIARKMIEAQNGRVWAESPGEGQGSTFYIELPLAEKGENKNKKKKGKQGKRTQKSKKSKNKKES